MPMDNTEKVPKFHCKFCDYYTSRKSQWKRHLETRKHAQSQMDNKKKVPKSSKKFQSKLLSIMNVYVVKNTSFAAACVNIKKNALVLMWIWNMLKKKKLRLYVKKKKLKKFK